MTIHDKFNSVILGPGAVDLTQIRIVDLASNPDWQPVLKLNGFSNVSYRSGLFRLQNRQTVRFFGGPKGRYVYLPSSKKGTSVMVETEQPEALVENLRRKWGYTPLADAQPHSP